MMQRAQKPFNCPIEVTPEKPPRTIYSLTAFGENIIPVLESMCELGTKYLDVLDMETPYCHPIQI